ncbi:MAG TPA: FG-GAP-like repeat-containing protein [Bdellovibrionales bacterium]|nr:FG-GAP-like repeat-containing protein [Bdellovibrionales bacterium]
MSRIRTIASVLILFLPAIALVTAFQNCAQPVPLDSGTSLGSSNARPTPKPGDVPGPSGDPLPPSNGNPSSSGWEGTCTADNTKEPMSWGVGTDSGYGVLTAFVKGESVALWFHLQGLLSARVCKMNGTGWTVKGMADVDGVFPKDVIWRNADGRVAIWRMQGSNRVSGAILANTISSDWRLEGVADLDGDNREDLIWRHNDGRIHAWIMNGAQVSAASDIGNLATNWRLRGVGDFDGDGKDDLLYREVAGAMGIWFMNGFAVKSYQAVTATAPNANPTHGIKAAGDFDGDGKADLFFQNADGQFFLWKMNGAVGFQPNITFANWIYTVNSTQLITVDGYTDMILTGTVSGTTYLYVQTMRNLMPEVRYTTGEIQPGWTIFTFDRL